MKKIEQICVKHGLVFRDRISYVDRDTVRFLGRVTPHGPSRDDHPVANSLEQRKWTRRGTSGGHSKWMRILAGLNMDRKAIGDKAEDFTNQKKQLEARIKAPRKRPATLRAAQTIARRDSNRTGTNSAATRGILFLGDKPTRLQEQHFGEDFKKLHKAVTSEIDPNKDKDILANQEDQAVEFCQAARNIFRKADRNLGTNQARNLLKQRIAQEEDSPLKDLYDTATTATSGSLFVRLCKNLESAPKHPDLLVRYRESTDVGVAEVSLEPCAQKDIGDLCRVSLWTKRILDELVTKMDITEEAQVVFFQVIGKNCTFYAMRRLGTVCVAVEMAKIKIAYTISDVLTGFEEGVQGWLLVDRTFQNLVSTLQSALPRKPDSLPPPVFAGLSTPRSRRMSRDTHRFFRLGSLVW
ncbi:unnamed protein product [Mortierella alpina]